MAAYILLTREHTRNAGELEKYNEVAPATFKGHPARFLVFHGKPEVLEGPPAEDLMLAVFPSMEAARAWYDSDAYAQARIHRYLGGDFRCLIVENRDLTT